MRAQLRVRQAGASRLYGANANSALDAAQVRFYERGGCACAELETEIDGSFAELAALCDPRGWSRSPDFWASHRIAHSTNARGDVWPRLERDAKGRVVAIAAEDSLPLGQTWRGFLFEDFRWAMLGLTGSQFRNVLEIDFTADPISPRIQMNYTLFRSLSSQIGVIQSEGGILTDSGFVSADWLTGTRLRLRAAKYLRFAGMDGREAASGVLNAIASGILSDWLRLLVGVGVQSSPQPTAAAPKLPSLRLPTLSPGWGRVLGTYVEAAHAQQRTLASLTAPGSAPMGEWLRDASQTLVRTAQGWTQTWAEHAGGSRALEWFLDAQQEAVSARRLGLPRLRSAPHARAELLSITPLQTFEALERAVPLGPEHIELWIDARRGELVIAPQGLSRSSLRTSAPVQPGRYALRIGVSAGSYAQTLEAQVQIARHV